ncbi:hypothetical protein BLA28_20160 [Eisenbergiella tayi]|uniref:hypothetical protein n=1 Tax=Eisenbergiella tayi TaxID=1432052 RepID=UPI0008FD506C|nr:hypothetical protein [Eisenbergiella tayi]OIZ62711.1 hypothetical protein BLA28_20160 [Eisenbergiella tayi]
MRKTKFECAENPIMVNVEQLQARLNCGYKTAVQIGQEAKARVYVGRRVWYNINKVESYLEKIAV